jgi:hypothetical protein
MSDSDSEADTEDYEPPEPTWRWLEADEFMEAEFMDDEPHGSRMIMVFTFVITLCAIVLGLQSAFTCTCNLNF